MPTATIRSRLLLEVQMLPPSEPTPPEKLLESQKMMSFPGTVTYERGLDVVTTSGFVAVTNEFAVVFGDNGALVRDQKRTLVPLHRVYDIQGDE